MNKKHFISRAVLSALISVSGATPFGGGKFPTPPTPWGMPQGAPPLPAEQPTLYEKCYGVAGHHENDCAYASFDGDPSSCAGTAKACDSGAWRWVPLGQCEAIAVGADEAGRMMKGTLEPSMDRGTPLRCTPFNPKVVASKDYGL
jgi:uncharacterized membrane protein